MNGETSWCQQLQISSTIHKFHEESYTLVKWSLSVNCNQILGHVTEQNCIAKFHMSAVRQNGLHKKHNVQYSWCMLSIENMIFTCV